MNDIPDRPPRPATRSTAAARSWTSPHTYLSEDQVRAHLEACGLPLGPPEHAREGPGRKTALDDWHSALTSAN
jgi:hypothetical protein